MRLEIKSHWVKYTLYDIQMVHDSTTTFIENLRNNKAYIMNKYKIVR